MEHPVRDETRCLVIALTVVAVVWVVLFIWRVQAHQPNVDDYSYASTARSLLHGDPISAFLRTGQTAPLVPAMAAVGAALWGIYGALSIELPLLLLLVAGSYALARMWVSPTAAMVIALVAGLNTGVLGYAMMLNFAVASTAAVIWCFVAYSRSNHLRKPRWAMIFAIAMAALALSRSMAPVYVAPLVLVVACDYVVDVRKTGDLLRWPVLTALGVVLVLAGPWWLVSGHDAIHYLLNAGYSPSSGFASRGLTLTPSAIETRINLELSYLGRFQSLVLRGALLAAVIVAFLYRRRLNAKYLWMLAVWSVLTLLILSTSSNPGTAFGLPVVVVVIVLCGAVLGQFPMLVLRWAMVPLAGVVIVGLVFQFTSSTSNWLPGPPYRLQVVEAGGTSRTDVGLITSQVADAIGRARTVLVRNDPIVNENGLHWERGTQTGVLRPPFGQAGTAGAISYLRDANALITGSSIFSSFLVSLDQVAIDKAALRDGYRPYKVWVVSRYNNIVVWRRGSVGLDFPPPTTIMLRPKAAGNVVSGTYYLDAQASQFVGVEKVQFQINAGALQHEVVITAYASPFGWLAGWDTKTFPNGVYAIRSVAEDVFGQITRSLPVVVRVDNR